MYYKMPLQSKSNHVHLVFFDNQSDYAVNFLHATEEKTLVNQWIAYCIGRYMELPIPKAEIVEMPTSFLHDIPNLNSYTQQNAKQLAVFFLENCISIDEEKTYSISNQGDFAKTIVFDYWLCNTNRTNHNVWLQEITPGIYKYWMMDHSEIFASLSWTAEDLTKLPENVLNNNTHKTMASLITNEKEFAKQIELIQTIPTLLLEEILSLIPEEWNISTKEKEAVVKALNHRRYEIVPNIINQFIQYRIY
ncbi:HipA family kinase [Chengkuizengella axinellae]|uniref:HipA-like kinase domain-containing protein n=1 Tax=Chengkuizengella axinellae TaxID=3064388 RepID=A0ABT9J641_9BACL|nr:HipA family kinase [Chengkuizengella sp. 2205SS18-9]MDP5276419.1 hypothetical protein [Chengkuizengella sp. 2205SS18-9]